MENQIANPGTEQVQVTDEQGNVTTEERTKDTTDLNNQLTQAKTDLETAKTELATAQSDYDSKKSAYDSAVSATESARQSVQSASDSVISANRSVESAQSSLNNTTSSANSNVYSQAQAAKSNELSAQSNTLSAKQEIEKSQEELSKATVYASQDGTVTNVNIVKGQTYSGTDAVVIDNVTSLKATADIDEAQIPSVQVGQKVHPEAVILPEGEAVGIGIAQGEIGGEKDQHQRRGREVLEGQDALDLLPFKKPQEGQGYHAEHRPR